MNIPCRRSKKTGIRLRGSTAFVILCGCLIGLTSCGSDADTQRPIEPTNRVRIGLEIFLESPPVWIKGKRIGLLTNPTGLTSDLRSGIRLMMDHSDLDLKVLYGPEHGVRGNAQAGEFIPYFMDEVYQLPVFSLYGQFQKPDPGMLNDIDSTMRSFDTQTTGKIPEREMVQDIEVMIFDIQDVGTRIYTYIATMAYCMQACAEEGIAFVVLDRPNPLNGVDMEGPLLEYPEFSSFVGLYPIPVRHGMTAGELAGYFNDQFLDPKVDLHVIPMQGWQREMWFDDTGLPWIIPSPNMPTLATAAVYPGQVFLEGTNASEGRGTTKPFELMGAPWINGNLLSRNMNAQNLPGVFFREAWFTPTFSKFRGELCGGVEIHVTDRTRFRSFDVMLTILATLRRLYPGKLTFHSEYFDLIMGTSRIRKALEDGKDPDEIAASCQDDLDAFSIRREPYLLYR